VSELLDRIQREIRERTIYDVESSLAQDEDAALPVIAQLPAR
jgi:hypothetical protein